MIFMPMVQWQAFSAIHWIHFVRKKVVRRFLIFEISWREYLLLMKEVKCLL